MKKETGKKLCLAAGLLGAFVLWTVAVRTVDVGNIGPEGSAVGFAALNGFIHELTGVNRTLYILTDWLGLVPLGIVLSFALLGLAQWVRRKHILKVDRSILLLGGFYGTVLAVYVLFEVLAVNYRPVLVAGVLEASYPSSTTVLVLCVMPTAAMRLNAWLQNPLLKKCAAGAIAVFTVFMVVGRLISGVHWFTDIVGGAILSAGLVNLYQGLEQS